MLAGQCGRERGHYKASLGQICNAASVRTRLGSRRGAKRLKGEPIRRNFLFRLALLGPLQTTIAPATGVRSARLAQGALELVQRARSSETEPAGRARARRRLDPT